MANTKEDSTELHDMSIAMLVPFEWEVAESKRRVTHPLQRTKPQSVGHPKSSHYFKDVLPAVGETHLKARLPRIADQ